MRKIPWHAHQTIGLAIALFGTLLLFRWIFQIGAITRLIPGSAAMELNAPLLLLAAGICCMFYPPRERYPAPLRILLGLCGALLLILPGLHMVQHLFDVSLGIDIVRVPVAPTESRPHPGRMSPNAALAFLCTGIALSLIARKRGDSHKHLLALTAIFITMLIGLTGLAGYFLRLETLYRLAAFNQMPLPTAAGIILMGCGLWLLLQNILSRRHLTTRQYQRRITRRAIAALTLVAVAAGVIGFAVMRDAFEDALAKSIMLGATSNAASLGNSLEDSLSLHRIIVSHPGLKQQFVRLQKQPQDPDARAILRENADILMAAGLDGVRLYDADGQLVAGGGGAMLNDLAPLAHRLIRAEQVAYLVWQDGYLLHTENKIVAAGQTVGTVVAEQRLPAFDKLLRDLQASSPSTDALLCSRSDNTAVCAPSRFNSSLTSIPLAGGGRGLSLPIELALLGQSGFMNTRDLRKTPVIAAYAPLQELGLGIVITMDTETLYEPLKHQIRLLAAALAALVSVGTMALQLAIRPLLEKLANIERRLRAITDNVPVLITYIDREYKLRFCNKTFEEWFGVPAAAALNNYVVNAIGPALYAQRRANIDRALAGERVEFELSSTALGITRHLHNTYIPDIASDGTVAGIYTLSMDVTPLKEVQQQLQQMARFDALTGLPNRYQMNEKLIEAILRCRRSEEPMAVMFLDIDHFKRINDSLGHAGGDEVLREFGRRLKNSVRQTDTVCRLAGDEFVIIFEQIGGIENAEDIARKIIANVEAPCEIKGKPLRIGTSIGIAYCPGQPPAPDALLNQADQVLYEAKAAGRGTFRLVNC